ncbi:sigma-70 family RNA polymerase sigma factor [Streptomyces sp. NPDC057430]|uniref:sigma-70 family RNA polymerase sigma factor n=1 Tax=Streptomyces sp. NPDC057430 TaxID=3346131 RepID=UPI0036826BAB
MTPARTDERALAALQQEHGRALFRFILGLTFGDRHRAEDLVQETFVRVWQHPEALRSDHESMRPWLFTVARRLAIDARRARQARPKELSDMALEKTPSAVDPSERSMAGLDVRQALAGLSAEHRAVLVLVYFRGMSVAEASEVLDIPPGTVKSRTYYALRGLKEALQG